MTQSIENIQNQVQSIGTQVQGALKKMNAEIDQYKFSVEKVGDGLYVDLGLRLKIRPTERKEDGGREITP